MDNWEMQNLQLARNISILNKGMKLKPLHLSSSAFYSAAQQLAGGSEGAAWGDLIRAFHWQPQLLPMGIDSAQSGLPHHRAPLMALLQSWHALLPPRGRGRPLRLVDTRW